MAKLKTLWLDRANLDFQKAYYSGGGPGRNNELDLICVALSDLAIGLSDFVKQLSDQFDTLKSEMLSLRSTHLGRPSMAYQNWPNR